MSDFTTELMHALQKDFPLNEFFRQQLESAVNGLLQSEITAFLGYEKHSSDGWNSGNSRNGSYVRTLTTSYGDLRILVPRDRNGLFAQKTIPRHTQHTDALETTVIQLYRHGVTTREISSLIEQMYGHHYTPSTVSNIAKAADEQVRQFHSRPVAKRYAVIYADATYLNVRRDSVAKEALHVLLGITPEGYKEVRDFALYPTETAANYREMLQGLKERGLEEVLLFVSDGLNGLCAALREEFPAVRHQSCWVHLSRLVARYVRKTDRKDVLSALSAVYKQQNASDAACALEEFLVCYGSKYPKLKRIFSECDSLYTFYEFPPSIWASIYTSNPLENNNKGLKHLTKKKEQFPNEDSLERFVCAYYSEYNRKSGDRVQKGFQEATPLLLDMFP